MKKFFRLLLLFVGLPIAFLVAHFLVIKKLDNAAMEAPHFYTSDYNSKQPYKLPSLFTEGQRFYIKMATASGDTILGAGDTGGGISMLLPGAGSRPQIRSIVRTALMKGFYPVKYVPFRQLVTDSRIPGPVPLRDKILRRPFSRIAAPFLIIPPEDEEIRAFAATMQCDVFLGQNFFMGHAWTLDYIHHEIWVNTPLPAGGRGKAGVQVLGFRKNASGINIYGHPSMQIEVDGQLIDVLFDTGASMMLTEAGKKALNTKESTAGASFISASVFDAWRQRHPDWKYYKGADKMGDAIEVPAIKISGYEAGPVLFARRPDEAWSQGMIHSMDKVVKGAIGGSALQYFKVMIDYNSALISFER